ncbi:hypothetical protein BZA77DRAFT_341893 [Pyronema omphalodes]|nr:hypothetical protein BZA77DRAFT_341893 [Pyronema omphalodes]
MLRSLCLASLEIRNTGGCRWIGFVSCGLVLWIASCELVLWIGLVSCFLFLIVENDWYSASMTSLPGTVIEIQTLPYSATNEASGIRIFDSEKPDGDGYINERMICTAEKSPPWSHEYSQPQSQPQLRLLYTIATYAECYYGVQYSCTPIRGKEFFPRDRRIEAGCIYHDWKSQRHTNTISKYGIIFIYQPARPVLIVNR